MNDEIKRIGGSLPPIGMPGAPSPTIQQNPEQVSFSKVLGNIVSDVNQMQQAAAQSTDKLLAGELEDVHQVVVAMEEAATSFKLLMEVRNKMVDAYREVMKMQV